MSKKVNKKNKPLITTIIILFIGIISMVAIVILSQNNQMYDYSNKDVVKKVRDPKGNKLVILKDEEYIYKVYKEYHYKEAENLEKKAKKFTEKQVDNSKATKKQKEAMKQLLYYLTVEIPPNEFEIKRALLKEFDEETVDYAMNNTGVDWEEQAYIQSVELLAGTGHSKKRLISLMKFEGFSDKVAKKVANDKKHDYYEQALYEACFLRFTEPLYDKTFTKKDAKEQLKERGYTKDEIDFAVKVIYDEMKNQ